MSTGKAYTPHHANKGMPYVRLYTAMLGDDDLLDTSDSAQLLAVKMLLWTAQQGTSGVIPSDPRRVQRFAHLEDGHAAVTRCLDELRTARFLVDTEDSTDLLIRSYARYQADLGGSKTRPESNSKSSFVQHHRLGNGAHPEGNVDGCASCTAGLPSPAPAEQETPAQRAAEVEVPPSESDELTAKDVNALVWSVFDKQVEKDADAGLPVLDTYLDLVGALPAAVSKYGHVSRVTATTLENLLVSHAVQSLWSTGEKLPVGVERDVHGFRKHLGTERTLELVAKHAGKRSPADYIRGILKNEGVAA